MGVKINGIENAFFQHGGAVVCSKGVSTPSALHVDILSTNIDEIKTAVWHKLN